MERETHQVNPAANGLEFRSSAFAGQTRADLPATETAIEVGFTRDPTSVGAIAGYLQAAQEAESRGVLNTNTNTNTNTNGRVEFGSV